MSQQLTISLAGATLLCDYRRDVERAELTQLIQLLKKWRTANELTYPGRQSATHADFTYSIFGNVISIIDLNLGNRSVTNDVESVLRKIEHFHQAPIFGYKLMYRDYDGVWDGINWDGKHASFFALRETEEGRAREKLLARCK